MNAAVHMPPRVEFRSMQKAGNTPTLAELQERSAIALAEMKKIEKRFTESGERDMPAEDRASFDRHRSEASAAQSAVERQRQIDDIDRAVSAPAITRDGGRDGNYEQRVRTEFNPMRAIASAAGQPVEAGLEHELSAEAQRRDGRSAQGAYFPREWFQVERRNMFAGGNAADLIPEVHRPDQFVDLRRESMTVAQLGARTMTDAKGNVHIPKQTSGGQAVWLDEHESVSESDAAYETIESRPRTLAVMMGMSRRVDINAQPSGMDLMRREIATTAGVELNRAALVADGSGNQPTGLLASNGLQVQPLTAAANYSDLVTYQQKLAEAHALVGSPGWLTTPKGYSFVRSMQRSPDTPVMTSPRVLVDHPIAQTTHLSDEGGAGSDETTLLIGDFSQMMIVMWGGIDVLPNPYADSVYSKGGMLITLFMDADVVILRPESFVVSEGLVL